MLERSSLVLVTLLGVGCGSAASQTPGSPAATGVERFTFDLAARVYATDTSSLKVDEVSNVSITTPLMIVATADPTTPIKLLAFDSKAKRWASKFEVPSGGVLPSVAHRIDALLSLTSGDVTPPTILFGARNEATLENEGLFLAQWGAEHYDVSKVAGSDPAGRTYVALTVGPSDTVVASSVEPAAAAPTAATLWSFKNGALTLVASHPGVLAIDPAVSPSTRRPVLATPYEGRMTFGQSVLVSQQRKADHVTVILTPVTATGFGADIELPPPVGIDLLDTSTSQARTSRATPGVFLADYVLFGGADGFLYHLDFDVPTPELVLRRGPERVQAGSSLVLGSFGGGFSTDLVQGGVAGSPGLELLIGRYAPLPAFTPRPGNSTLATGPALWPRAISFRTFQDTEPDPRTFIFTVTAGNSGAFDTALLTIVPAPLPAQDALACFPPDAPTLQVPFACTLPEPCAAVSGTAGFGLYPEAPKIDVAAGKCVLQHLRDTTPAHFAITMSTLEGAIVQDIWTHGDGTAVVWRHDHYDLSFDNCAPRRLRRQDDAFFTACLAETSEKAIYQCLFTWWSEGSCATAGAPTCPKS